MNRRTFVLGGMAGAFAATAAGFWRWQEITPEVRYPGRMMGHRLRDHEPMPASQSVVDTEVAIIGSGIAGLSTAWKLQREGFEKFVVLAGPEMYGNARSGQFGSLGYPTGAHYLPLPSMESTHVREMLEDFRIILADPYDAKPYYDEAALVAAPSERLLVGTRWQDGFVPRDGVSQADLDEHGRFFEHVELLSAKRGHDGRRIFVVPVALASEDPAWRRLDQLSFKDWLVASGYRSDSLHWYLDYCCRDDYGRHYDRVSAWFGLHYFCSRVGDASNAQKGTYLTWPQGLGMLARRLGEACAPHRLMQGSAVRVSPGPDAVTVEALVSEADTVRTVTIRARRVVLAVPLFVAAHLCADLGTMGFDALAHMPQYAPWLVTNFLMHDFPGEREGAPLAWDNLVYQQPGLGFVVSTHQELRVSRPRQTVFTAYRALADMEPVAARRWLDQARPQQLLDMAAEDLRRAYGWKLAPCVERVEITVRAHAMATPVPGILSNRGLVALREQNGAILFAHSDLSGYSVFEEASWWGVRAALRIMEAGREIPVAGLS